MKNKIIGTFVLVVVAAVIYVFATPTYREGGPSVAGREAINFPLKYDGRSMHLSDLRGKVVLLNFWASWCPPCLEETPSLNRLQEQIAPKGGVVLGVSVDEDGKAYEKFLKTNHVVFPTYRDPTSKIASEYGTSMFPESYLIDRQGRLQRKIVGPQDWQSHTILAPIEALLNEK